jgi:hypothetical protein
LSYLSSLKKNIKKETNERNEEMMPRGTRSIALTISLLMKNKAVCRAASPMLVMNLKKKEKVCQT